MGVGLQGCVSDVAIPGCSAAGSTGPLVRTRLTDGEYLQRVHPHPRVEHLQLAVPRIDNVLYAVDCSYS